MPVRVVARLDDLRERRGRVVVVDGRELALFRRGDDVFALDNVCVHLGGPLGEGEVEDGCVVCPWHGWRYELATGRSPVNDRIAVATYRSWVEEGDVLVDLPT